MKKRIIVIVAVALVAVVALIMFAEKTGPRSRKPVPTVSYRLSPDGTRLDVGILIPGNPSDKELQKLLPKLMPKIKNGPPDPNTVI